MKKILAVTLILALLMPFAFADGIDLSQFTFEELAELRDLIQKEMMLRDEWQEVTVPVGVYRIGIDIPAGHWNITASKNSNYGWCSLVYCDLLDESGKMGSRRGRFYYYNQVKYAGSKASVEATNIDFELADGTYLIIENGAAVFTPYTGKPSLGFK